MRKIVGAIVVTAILSGCITTDNEIDSGGIRPHWGKSYGPPMVPGVSGPYGTPVGVSPLYAGAGPMTDFEAKQKMWSNSVPANYVNFTPPGGGQGGPMNLPNIPMPPGGGMSPSGVPFAPGFPTGAPVGPGGPGGGPGGPGMPFGAGGYPPMLPPGGPGMMMPGGPGMGMPGGPGMMPGGPGMMPGGPGMGMPGSPFGPGGPPMTGPKLTNFFNPGAASSGIMQTSYNPAGPMTDPNVMPAQFSSSSPVGAMFPAQRTQVFINRPAGMKVFWSTQGRDGKPSYSITPLETPGRYNFAQGAIYRLKLTHIPGRVGLELYPTLEVVPTSPKTNEFLAHNSVPLEFSDDDFKQVVDRNYIVKVIYLPDPQFQDVAGAGPDEIVSSRLEPGQDPIQEALRRGSILLVLRIGNIDQEVPSSPSLTSPIPGSGAGGGTVPSPTLAPGAMGLPPSFQVPYFGPPAMVPNAIMMPPAGVPFAPLVPPGPLPPGAGADAEKQKRVAPPLPPLPEEQKDKKNLELPFGPPPPVKDPEIKPEELPTPKKDGKPQLPPISPFLQLPGEGDKNPVVIPDLPQPNVAPPKGDAKPPAAEPKKDAAQPNPAPQSLKGEPINVFPPLPGLAPPVPPLELPPIPPAPAEPKSTTPAPAPAVPPSNSVTPPAPAPAPAAPSNNSVTPPPSPSALPALPAFPPLSPGTKSNP